MPHDVQPCKHLTAVPPDIEKALDRAHHERFAEPTRPGEQRDFIICVLNQLVNQFGLIHIVSAVFANLIEELAANRHSHAHMSRSSFPISISDAAPTHRRGIRQGSFAMPLPRFFTEPLIKVSPTVHDSGGECYPLTSETPGYNPG